MADHKYIRKEMRNGKWVYIYDDPEATKSTAAAQVIIAAKIHSENKKLRAYYAH